MADDTDPCVYYWCLNGEVLAGPLDCPDGTGVEPGYRGEATPCQLHLAGCKASDSSGCKWEHVSHTYTVVQFMQ